VDPYRSKEFKSQCSLDIFRIKQCDEKMIQPVEASEEPCLEWQKARCEKSPSEEPIQPVESSEEPIQPVESSEEPCLEWQKARCEKSSSEEPIQPVDTEYYS